MGRIISTKDVELEGLDKTLYEIILDQSPDPIFCFAPDGTYLYINLAFSKAFNLMPSDIVGKRIWDVFPGKEGDMRFAAVKKALETKAEVVLDVKVEAVDGDRYYMTSVTPIMDSETIPRAAICISKEITLRKRMELALKEAKEETELKNQRLDMAVKELYIKSITDGLTRIFNRQHCVELLEDAIKRYEKKPHDISLILLDIDYYKKINDTYGHMIGDQALVEFSSMLKDHFELYGHVGRYGGEEFIVVLPNISKRDALDMVEEFRLLVENNAFTNEKIHFTFSGGLSQYSGGDIDEFMNGTDVKMYDAKKQGRNRIVE